MVGAFLFDFAVCEDDYYVQFSASLCFIVFYLGETASTRLPM